MGIVAERTALVRNINRAFGPTQIARTARHLSALPARADFLDISKALGFLETLDRGNFPRYRRLLPIPKLVRRILTITYRTSLFNKPKPIPMRIQIKDGPHGVEVRSTDRLIYVILTRPAPKARKRKAGDRTGR